MSIEKLIEQIIKVRAKLFSSLNTREQEILESRYGINRTKSTLAAIGKKHGLSRERVRQIESRAKSRLANEIQKTFPGYFDELLNVCQESGGVMTEKLITASINSDVNNLNYFKLIMDIAPDVMAVKSDDLLGKVWRLKQTSVSKINKLAKLIEDELRKINQPINVNKFVLSLKDKESYDEKLFSALKNSSKRFMINGSLIGLSTDRTINPKTVSDKVLYILEELKKPIHFAKIAEEIEIYGFDKKKINKSTVHNELIASEKFVLIGRGIYALKKWGYRRGTLQELIADYLEKSGAPKDLESILEHISTERAVKRNTILVNLAKSDKIIKTKSGDYTLV